MLPLIEILLFQPLLALIYPPSLAAIRTTSLIICVCWPLNSNNMWPQSASMFDSLILASGVDELKLT